jgi:hypothetical protein
MPRVFIVLILASLMVSCISRNVVVFDSLKDAKSCTLLKAKSKDYNFIIENLVSDELVSKMIAKHGEEKWKARFIKDKLENLPFYFSWLKKAVPKIFEEKVSIYGEHGCYAVFIKEGGGYKLLDFGQNISSM